MDSPSRSAQRPRWWQWPTVLSLDAPAVALLWQWLLAKAADVALAPPRAFVLGASVWLAYSADRWVEGWRLAPERIRTKRHYFYRRRRWAVLVLWLAVLGADVAAAARGLNPAEFRDGLILLGPVVAYLLSHQLIHRHRRGRVPKELCVAGLLGAGVALFIFPGAAGVQLKSAAPALALFLLLCFANCALISVWESLVDQSHGQVSWARQFRWGSALARILPWLVAAAALALVPSSHGQARTAALCAGASGLLLGVVDRAERRLGWEWARVLADVALMAPVVPWLWSLRP